MEDMYTYLTIIFLFTFWNHVSYWGFQYDYGSEIMSIRDGGIIPRKVKLKVASRKKSRSIQNSTDAEENVEVQKSELVGSRDQPQLWEKQSLVVIDPFISEKV